MGKQSAPTIKKLDESRYSISKRRYRENDWGLEPCCINNECKMILKKNDIVVSKIKYGGVKVLYDPWCGWEKAIMGSDEMIGELENLGISGNEPKKWWPDANDRINNLEDRIKRMVNPREDGYFLNDEFILIKIEAESFDEDNLVYEYKEVQREMVLL